MVGVTVTISDVFIIYRAGQRGQRKKEGLVPSCHWSISLERKTIFEEKKKKKKTQKKVFFRSLEYDFVNVFYG